jgi:hypothetical protein
MKPQSSKFQSHSFNHFKIIEVQICEVSLAKLWVWIVYFPW